MAVKLGRGPARPNLPIGQITWPIGIARPPGLRRRIVAACGLVTTDAAALGALHGLSRRSPKTQGENPGALSEHSSSRLSSAQGQDSEEGPAAAGTRELDLDARDHRNPGTHGRCI